MFSKRLFLFLVIFAWMCCVYGRRGGGGGGRGGGSRGGSRGSSRGSSRSTSSSSRSRYSPKPNRFDKGGVKKFATIGAVAYASRKMKPSIKFSGFGGVSFEWRSTTTCHECVSIKGSNPKCEDLSRNSTSVVGSCQTTSSRPYCSIEYGVLANDQKYVRRSCDERRCTSCSSDSRANGTCYTFQCNLCNWKECNGGAIEKVFSDEWKGCLPDPSKTAKIFDTVDTCGAIGMKSGYAMIFLVILSKLLIH